MTAEAQIRALLAQFSPAQRRLIAATRRTLRARMPTAFEFVYQYATAFVIGYSANNNPSQGVAAIKANTDGVVLHLHAGQSLPDPDKRLSGKTGTTRRLALENLRTLKDAAVLALIDAAIARSVVPFARTGTGSVLIRTGKR